MGRFLSCLLLVLIGISCHMEVPEMTLDFSAESDKGTVTFKNNSQGAESFVWDFGDGSPVSTETAPVHKYNSSNNYKVRLIAKGNGGTRGLEKTIPVNVDVALIKGFDKVWEFSFGGSEEDVMKAIVKTSDGGAIFVGRSRSAPNNGRADVRVIRINGNGQMMWDKNFGGTGDDEGNCILEVSGGYLIGGSSNSGSGLGKDAGTYGDYDYWLIKIDGNGNKLWDKNYGGSSFDFMSSIMPSNDGGFLLGGSSSSMLGAGKVTVNPGGTNFWVVRIDANGNYKTDFGYGNGPINYLTSMSKTTDNNILLIGYSDKKQYDAAAYGGVSDFWVVKVNQAGAKIADYRFGGSNEDKASTGTSEERNVVGGTSNSINIVSDRPTNVPARGGKDFLVCRFDDSGVETWRRTYGGSGDDVLNNLIVLTGGKNLFMAGESSSPVSGTKGAPAHGALDGWIVKTDLSGNTLLDDSFGGTGTDRITCVTDLGGGSYLLAGESDSAAGSGNKTAPARGGLDFWVIRIKEK